MDLEELKNIAFSEEYGGGDLAIITIMGLKLPHSTSFDPLGKLWAQLRRNIRRKHAIDVVGLFNYDDEQASIICKFRLSTAETTYPFEQLIGIFEETFFTWAQEFEDLLVCFLHDQHGLAAYAKLYAMGATLTEYKRLFNEFLKEHKHRTDKDEKRSKKDDEKAAAQAADAAKRAAKRTAKAQDRAHRDPESQDHAHRTPHPYEY